MPSDQSDGSARSSAAKRLRPSGGYRTLHSFQVTTVIYDGTVSFCERFVDKRSRLVDQMTQAARSGRQNIAEGSRASATSSQTELRLINVARASLDELLLDFEDYLRQHGLPQWAKDSPEALAVRRVGQQLAKSDQSDQSNPPDQSALYRPWLAHKDPAVVANTLICLIHQANYLLDQQVRALEKEFVTKGGYSEQLAAARLAHRSAKDRPAPSSSPPSPPPCPVCGSLMAVRTAKKGPRAGNQFWGCTKYPACKGTKPV
ncbi:MAG: four helix bundle protein [Verrucomicrobia bacterium]|nr:four helix bundle protein [Verrucomicrobiota bacterium]